MKGLFCVVIGSVLALRVDKYHDLTTLDGLDDKTVCNTAIGFSNEKDNAWCRQECLKTLENGYKPNTFLSLGDNANWCFFQHFAKGENDEYVLDDCWSANSSFAPDNLKHLRLLQQEPVDSPAECQTLCQKEPECYRMQWMVKTGKCYMFNLRQAQAVSSDRSFVIGRPELGDDLCPEAGACPKTCFTVFQGTTKPFKSEVISGWKWCHPQSTDCLIPSMPMKNRFKVQYCSDSHANEEDQAAQA